MLIFNKLCVSICVHELFLPIEIYQYFWNFHIFDCFGFYFMSFLSLLAPFSNGTSCLISLIYTLIVFLLMLVASAICLIVNSSVLDILKVMSKISFVIVFSLLSYHLLKFKFIDLQGFSLQLQSFAFNLQNNSEIIFDNIMIIFHNNMIIFD